MKKEELENIIINLLNDKATAQEIIALEEAIKIPVNKKLFESYIQTDYLLNLQSQPFDSNSAKAVFLKKIDTGDAKLKISWHKKSLTVLKYAALIALIFLVKDSITTSNQIEVISEDAITLELNDGTIKIINPDDSQEIINSKGFVLLKQGGDKLVYNNNLTTSTFEEVTLTYNKLYVPFAKKFQVELSDGTLVYLNSGSTLKYPVKFLNGKSREVFLDGEAYFVVAKDKSVPFIVNANEISTQVYGTQFNISSYKEDSSLEIVLIEGSIGVYDNGNLENKEDQLMLVPNEKASFNKKELEFSKETVSVKNYIAWKDGVLWFENTPFKNIIKKLERSYAVSIKNNYEDLDDIEFTGAFDIETETIDQILNAFQSYKEFEYISTNNKIIIN